MIDTPDNSSPVSTPASPPPPRGVAWIGIDEAQRRCKLSDRRLRQLCQQQWRAAGLARLDKGQWTLREDADPRLARVQFAQAMPFDWNKYSGEQRRQITFKMSILCEYSAYLKSAFARNQGKQAATADFLLILQTRGHAIPARTLYAWQKRLSGFGPGGLVDGRWDRQKTDRDADPFFAEFKHFYLSPRNLKVTDCHRFACQSAQANGWPLRSYDACHRFIQTIPKAVRVLRRKGEEAYTNECEPYIERDYSTLESNELWVGDHHQFDVLVNAGGPKLVRPWLTAWQDMRSRKIVGWTLFAGDPNTDTILEAFRMGCLDCGVPNGVYVDNGKDYDSYALNGRTKKDRWAKRTIRIPPDAGSDSMEADAQSAAGASAGVFTALNVTVTHCWPYHGQSKPIERFFGTLEMRTCVWETYCGSSTKSKPEDLQLQIERGKAPLLKDFIAWFADWLKSYHQGPHTGDAMNGKSPDLVFAENLRGKKTVDNNLLDALLLPRTKPVKVGQNGVMYRGLRYGQYEPALIPLFGKQVILAVDNQNIASVQVWSMDNKFICLADANQRVPANASSKDLRDAIAQKKCAIKQNREYYKNRMRMADDLPDLITRSAAARRAADAAAESPPSPPPPPNIIPLQAQA